MSRDDRDAAEMLERSHRQQQRRLDELETAARALAAGSGGAAEIETVHEVVDYLERSAAKHVADEEETIFPRLEGRRELAEVIEILRREHIEHGRLQNELATVAADLDLPCPSELAESLLELATAIKEDYAAHIEREESSFIPAMSAVLGPAGMAEVLAEMKTRRGKGSGPGKGKGKGKGGKNKQGKKK